MCLCVFMVQASPEVMTSPHKTKAVFFRPESLQLELYVFLSVSLVPLLQHWPFTEVRSLSQKMIHSNCLESMDQDFNHLVMVAMGGWGGGVLFNDLDTSMVKLREMSWKRM